MAAFRGFAITPANSNFPQTHTHKNMITTTSTDAGLVALCKHLGVPVDDATECRFSHYGLAVWEVDGGEYALGTDAAADEAAQAYVADTVWAFNACFILEACDLPRDLAPAIRSFQEKECESANDALFALVEKCCKGGIERFARLAVSADGRGHFLSPHDGDEIELAGVFSAFRVN